MKVRVLSLILSLAALQWAGTIQAQDKNLNKSDEIRRNAVEAEKELARQFADFQKHLQSLKNRLERSQDPTNKDRAGQLQKVLDKADSAGIRVKFARLQDHLRKPAFDLEDFKSAAEQTEALARDLAELLEDLDGRNNKLAEEIAKTRKDIAAIETIIKEQQRIQAITEQDKTPVKENARLQEEVTGKTEDLIGKKKEASEGPKTKDIKSQPKEGKGGEKSEAKDAGKQKQGEAKENGPKDGKTGKENKEGEAKGAEKKPGTPDPKASEPKTGEKKDPKGGENAKQPEAKDSKGPKGSQAEPKDSKGKDAKGNEAKQANSKDAGKKDGGEPKAKEAGEAKGQQEPKNDPKADPKDNKNGEPKAKEKGEEPKTGAKDAPKDMKNPDAKPSDAKDAGKDSKQAEAKGGDPKPGQKSEAKPPIPSQGDPKDGGDQPQAKGDNKKQDPKASPPPQAGDKDQSTTKKKIQDAIDKMDQAKKKIENNDKPGAGDDQGKAIEDLKIAKKELEKLLKILREEELERLIANLKTRLERMLAMQLDVLTNPVEGTEATYRAILLNSDKKPTDEQVQKSLRLAEKEKNIITEATKALDLLESEGSAVAFPVAFEQVREDMKTVFRRLNGGGMVQIDVGPITQQIEKDIISSLEDMIKVLTKKEQDMKDKKDKDKAKPPKEGEQGPPPDPKLLDNLQELKMILAMQVRLNDRTKLYAKEFKEGQEQPMELNPNRILEINELRARQERIFDITSKIQKGDNK